VSRRIGRRNLISVDYPRHISGTHRPQGTNLGIAAMGHSAKRITADMLQHVSRFFLTEATLKAANAAMVSFHHRLGYSELSGTGNVSSSDGQRFGIQASSLLASFYPRYATIYWRSNRAA